MWFILDYAEKEKQRGHWPWSLQFPPKDRRIPICQMNCIEMVYAVGVRQVSMSCVSVGYASFKILVYNFGEMHGNSYRKYAKYRIEIDCLDRCDRIQNR